MKLPVTGQINRGVLGHTLATCPPAITEESFLEGLKKLKGLGYKGTVIVAKMLLGAGIKPQTVTDMIKSEDMFGIDCGFLPGADFNPHDPDELQKCIEEVHAQAAYAVSLNKAGCGPKLIVGPFDIPWSYKGRYSRSGHENWVSVVSQDMLGSFGLLCAFEPLNKFESFVPDPFETIFSFAKEMGTYMHYDFGHAYMRKKSVADFRRMAPHCALVEFANIGREPLDAYQGIDFPELIKVMTLTPPGCFVSVEPFRPDIIDAFGLRAPNGPCTTTTDGFETLERDAAYLRKHGVML